MSVAMAGGSRAPDVPVAARMDRDRWPHAVVHRDRGLMPGLMAVRRATLRTDPGREGTAVECARIGLRALEGVVPA